MKKNILIFFSLLSMFCVMRADDVQPLHVADIGEVEPRLYIGTIKKTPQYVEINYEITVPGFVELHLFDPDGNKVWIKGRVTDRTGFDKIPIPAQGLKRKGERYTYFLRYKGKDYSGSFYAD
ncbi:MAG: hypothetical protein KDD63_07050 [Bacteroidetes bacterium]|nr:hypothetical protein [Bacteroidota bacterium]MCB0851957.1 hypothetical protein [Bacteroidota bacterium]